MKTPSPKKFELGNYFYNLAEISKDVFWIRSPDFKALYYINSAYEQVWKRTCENLYKTPEKWLESVLKADRPLIEAEVAQKYRSKSKDCYFVNYRIHRPSREIRWIKEIGFPLFENNVCIAYAGISKDITEDNHYLSDFDTPSYFFRFFAEKIKSVFWVRDPKYNKQLYVNPAYETLWGRTCKSLYENPSSWIETLHPDDRIPEHEANQRLQLHLEKGSDFQFEGRYRVIRPDGSIIWIKDTCFPIHDYETGFIGFAGIAEDITASVAHEQQLTEAKQKAETANFVKSEFLATMSHELRTPLNAILGMAQILKLKGLPEDLVGYVETISQAGNSLLSLVNDVLDFARLEAGKLSLHIASFDPRLLILQTVESIFYQAEDKGLALKVIFGKKIPKEVLGDERRIRQILLNLLSNAIKFTDYGHVYVHVSCLKSTISGVILSITVQDTGVGIDDDKLYYVFEKFSQIDSTYNRKNQGMGLGLSIAKELIEKMGGLITVKSILGKGSEFGFTLPFQIPVRKKTENIKPKKITREQKTNKGIHILIVEDNLVNQKIAKILLEDQGYTVGIANNGSEAIEMLAGNPLYALIFMDIGLPDSSGFEVAQKLRTYRKLKKIPIIAMTAHILERDKEKCYAVGMSDVIAKPILHAQLVEVLGRFL